MILCEECGEIYAAWRGQCPQFLNHMTDEQKEFLRTLVPDDSQCIGWIQ